MKTPITPTLAICLAGGVAAGIALARPADPAPASDAAVSAAVTDPTAAGATSLPTAPGRSEPIEIVDFAFNNIAVDPGSIVEVRNIDGVAHTVTAVGNEFDTGNIDGSGASTFAAPDSAGTYTYICTIHPSMQGSLIVN